MVARIPDTMAGKRDRAILLLGFAGAFRRSELAALNVEDLTFGADGVDALIRRSKSDQEGQGGRNLYPSVVMRVVPSVTFDFVQPGYRLQTLDNSKPHKIRFRIFGRGGLVRDADLRPLVRGIQLDAEL